MKATALNGYETRPYTARDLRDFAITKGLSKIELANIVCQGGMSSSALQKRIGKDDALLNPSLQNLLRLYLRYPDVIPMPERIIANDFFDSVLGGEDLIAPRYRGILFCTDRSCGYNWCRDTEPNAQIKAAMTAAKKLKLIHGLSESEVLEILVDSANAVAMSLNVDPLREGSWKGKSKTGEAMKLSVTKLSSKSVLNRGRRVLKNRDKKPNQDEVNLQRQKVRLLLATKKVEIQ